MSKNKFYDIANIRYEKEGKQLRVISASLQSENGKDYSETLAGMINELYEDESEIQGAVTTLCVEGTEDYLRYVDRENEDYELTIELHLIDANTGIEKMEVVEA